MVVCLLIVIKIAIESLSALYVFTCAIMHQDLEVLDQLLVRIQSIQELGLYHLILKELLNRVYTSTLLLPILVV